MLLVVIALVVYTRIFGGAGGVPMIDDSHSITIFSGLEARITAMLPEDAPQWIAGQYDHPNAKLQLTGRAKKKYIYIKKSRS